MQVSWISASLSMNQCICEASKLVNSRIMSQMNILLELHMH